MVNNRRPAAAFTPADQAERELILNELNTSMLVEASAGSGKTTAMVGRMVALLREGVCTMPALAAMTFTNKAAGEIRSRFQQALLQAAQSEANASKRRRMEQAIEESDQCFIGTIHAFCGRLLRERPLEAKIAVAFEEIDEERDALLRQETWERFVETCYAEDDELIHRLDAVGLSFADLREAFTTFADYPDVDDWPCTPVSAPATKALLNKLEDYHQHMEQLALRMPKNRLPDDFLMKQYCRLPRLALAYDLKKTNELMNFFQNYSKECSWDRLKKGAWDAINVSKDQLRDEMNRWNLWVTQEVLPALRQWRQHRYPLVLHILKRAQDFYDQIRRQQCLMNFQDLLLQTAQLLRRDEKVRDDYRRRYTHLLVDEFQDTDPLQAEILFLLTAQNKKTVHWWKAKPIQGSLFLVGDPQQSIYRFRRADIVTYEKAKHLILASGGQVVPLTTNFRSRKSLVQWVNACFRNFFPAERSVYAPQHRPMLEGRQDTESDHPSVYKFVVPKEDATGKLSNQAVVVQFEANKIANHIQEYLCKPNTSASDFMILTRNKAHLNIYAQALASRHIPVQITGQNGLASMPELRDLIQMFKALTQPDAELEWVGMLRGPYLGVSDSVLYRFKMAGGRWCHAYHIPETLDQEDRSIWQRVFNSIQRWQRWLKRLPKATAVERLMHDVGLTYRQLLLHGERQAIYGLGKALDWIRTHRNTAYTWADWIEELTRLCDQDRKISIQNSPLPDAPAVRVMNLHQAKGLEAKVVFLADPNGDREREPNFYIDRTEVRSKGYIIIRGVGKEFQQGPILAEPEDWEEVAPIAQEFEVKEQDRLRYVAATRAKDALIITQREAKQNVNFWAAFADDLEQQPELPILSKTSKQVTLSEAIALSEPQEWLQEIVTRLRTIIPETYQQQAAKRFALQGSKQPLFRIDDEDNDARRGLQWGSLLHGLLEKKLFLAECDLAKMAHTLALEEGFNQQDAEQAIAIINEVTKSAVWQRVLASPKRFAEVPIHYCDFDRSNGIKESIPTLFTGEVDLVFWEKDGWVIIDYKSDRIVRKQLKTVLNKYRPQLEVYKRLWEKTTRESVKEIGIYFLSLHEYAPI